MEDCVMGSIRVRKETEKLFVDFRYRGERCREHTALNDTPTNRRKLEKLLRHIEAEIAFGTFDYGRYFPNSILSPRFTSNGQGLAAISRVREAVASSAAVRLVESMPFREFANEWYSQYEIEWRRSYRPTVLGALHQFELFGAAEAFAFAALLIAAGFTAPAGVVVLLLGTVAYGLVKHRARRHWFRETFALVEAQIRRTIARPPAALTHDDARPA
jgi:Arm DNA-binding domain